MTCRWEYDPEGPSFWGAPGARLWPGASHHSTPKRPPTPMDTGTAPSPKRQEVVTEGYTDSQLVAYEQELSLDQHASQVDAVDQHQLD